MMYFTDTVIVFMSTVDLACELQVTFPCLGLAVCHMAPTLDHFCNLTSLSSI